MANVTVANLPSAATPVQGTDSLVITRDGTVVAKVPVTDALNGLTPSISIASPNNTIPVEAFVATNALGQTYANIDVAIVPKGTGAFSLQIPDGTTAGGNKRGPNAVDLQTSRTAATQVASGSVSFVAGSNNTVSGSISFALGNVNTVSGAVSGAFGDNNTVSSGTAFAFGIANNVSGSRACAIGETNTASGNFSVALNRFATTNGIQGQVAFGHNSDTLGRYQYTLTGLRQVTTGTTPTRATADGATASTANQLVLRNNSVVKVLGRVVAYDTVTLDAKEFEFSALVKRGAAAANTALVGTPSVTSAFADTAAAAWTVAVTADTTNGAVAVTVTGAGTNAIRWQIELMANETGGL